MIIYIDSAPFKFPEDIGTYRERLKREIVKFFVQVPATPGDLSDLPGVEIVQQRINGVIEFFNREKNPMP